MTHSSLKSYNGLDNNVFVFNEKSYNNDILPKFWRIQSFTHWMPQCYQRLTTESLNYAVDKFLWILWVRSLHPQNYILNKNYETIIIQVQLYPWNYVPMNLRNIMTIHQKLAPLEFIMSTISSSRTMLTQSHGINPWNHHGHKFTELKVQNPIE